MPKKCLPGLLQFIAKGMFTFRIGWTTLSLNFLDIVTFSLTSPPEKKNSELQSMQHKNTYTLEKIEQTFLPKLTCLSAFVLTLSPFPSLLLLYSSQTGYYFMSNLNEVQICIMKRCMPFQIYPAFHRPVLNLIGLAGGVTFLDQPQSEVKQNQTKPI